MGNQFPVETPMKSQAFVAALALAFGPVAGAQPDTTATPPPPQVPLSVFEAVQPPPPAGAVEDEPVIPPEPVRLRLDPNFTSGADLPPPSEPVTPQSEEEPQPDERQPPAGQ